MKIGRDVEAWKKGGRHACRGKWRKVSRKGGRGVDRAKDRKEEVERMRLRMGEAWREIDGRGREGSREKAGSEEWMFSRGLGWGVKDAENWMK